MPDDPISQLLNFTSTQFLWGAFINSWRGQNGQGHPESKYRKPATAPGACRGGRVSRI
jgi:hypothetical protein